MGAVVGAGLHLPNQAYKKLYPPPSSHLYLSIHLRSLLLACASSLRARGLAPCGVSPHGLLSARALSVCVSSSIRRLSPSWFLGAGTSRARGMLRGGTTKGVQLALDLQVTFKELCFVSIVGCARGACQ